MVLMLLAIAGITVAAALRRASAAAAFTQRQMEGYQRHHEMLGIHDYVRTWLSKTETSPELLASGARTGEVVHRFVVDNNVVILITVMDGQGTVCRSVAQAPHPDTKRWMIEMLSRLPPDRPDLTRRSGPPQISLQAAPDEVIDALAGFDAKVAAGLRDARDRGVKNATELQTTLQKRNIEDMVAQTLSQHIAFEPSLWRLNVEVVHPEAVNRYTLLGEKRANIVGLYEWRPVTESEAERLFSVFTPPDGGEARR
jgi:hypothetical protein